MDVYHVDDLSNKQDVGSAPGVKWTLSSHKPGAGVAALRDPDLSKLWQSDGVQPHVVDIQFPRRTAVTHVSIYLDVTMDDSYTPTSIGIRAGTCFHDLVEVRRRELESPKGWIHFALWPEGESEGSLPPPIRTYHLQVNIYANHLNGKDTHLRGVRVYGPPAEIRQAQAAKQRAQEHIQAELAKGGKNKADVRYRHAYRVLDSLLGGEGAGEGAREGNAHRDPPRSIDPAASAHHPQLPASSRDLSLTHSLR